MHLQRSSETSEEEDSHFCKGCPDREGACSTGCPFRDCFNAEAGHQGGNEASGFCKTCPDHEACATGYPFYTCCSPLA